MEFVLQDLKFSFRSLRKAPLFSLTAIFCLTLSIGAVSAIFSVFNAVVLDAYPFEDPDSLIDIQLTARDFNFDDPNDFTYTLPQRSLDPFLDEMGNERFTWKADRGFAITDLETPVSIQGSIVSSNYFDVVKPQTRMGRIFKDDDKDRPIVILSYRQWQTTWGGDPDILGKTITVDGVRHSVVGVLEREHRYPNYADLWVPERTLSDSGSRLQSRLSYNIITRLQVDQSSEQLNQELTLLSDRLIELDPGLFNRYRFRGFEVPALLARGAQLGETLQLLLVAVIALLLIASANVTNLMLSRMQQQEQELSLRSALGARRGRLVRRLMMESGLIAFASAILGVCLAYIILPIMVEQAGTLIQNPERVLIDLNVLIFSLFVTLTTILFVSLAPLIRVLSTDLAATLRAGGNKGMMGGGANIRHALVTAEAALTFMLLVGAGLMIKSFDRLQSVDMGIENNDLQTLVLHAPASRASGYHETMRFYDQIIDELESLPGVTAAAYTNAIPITDRSTSYSMSIEDFPPENPDDLIDPAPIGMIASNDFAEVLGVQLVEGRYLNEQDVTDGNQVLLITENMAKHHWPNQSALGKRIKRGAYTEETFQWWTIVGVVSAIRTNPTAPALHRYFRSANQHVLTRDYRDMRLVIRTEGEPRAIMPSIRREIRSVAANAVVSNELTMNERISNATRTQQMSMQIVLAFSLVGLILAIAGIFGVFSYNVQQRFREIGLRMVLGAKTLSIFMLVLKSAVGLGVLGLSIGLVLILSARDYIESYLFEVSGLDPFVYVNATLVLLISIIAAACLPARRATLTDPVNSLRE